MSCNEFEKQIVLFTELTSEEQAKVTAHLSNCKNCSEFFELVNQTNNLVQKASRVKVEVEDPFHLTNSIMTRIRAEEHVRGSWFDLLLRNIAFKNVKYGMAACSFILIIFFSIEQLQLPATGEVVSKNQSEKIVLNKKNFQNELSKSKAAVNLILANSCKSPFNITKVNEDCLKQRMGIYKEL